MEDRSDAWIINGPHVHRKQYVRYPLRRGQAYDHGTYINWVFADDADAKAFHLASHGEYKGTDSKGRHVIQTRV